MRMTKAIYDDLIQQIQEVFSQVEDIDFVAVQIHSGSQVHVIESEEMPFSRIPPFEDEHEGTIH